MKDLIISHDIGTSGCKSVIIDSSLNVLESHFEGYNTQSPRRDWLEQDPEEWWDAVCRSSQWLARRITCVYRIKCVVTTGQMMGCLPLSSNGGSLAPSIIWADLRSKSEAEDVRRIFGETKLYQITGQPLSCGYLLPKLLWLRKNFPDVYSQTYKFIQSKDYINYKFTNIIATDHTDAAYTLCYDLAERKWSQEILDAFNLSIDKLPVILNSTEVLGMMTPSALECCGFPVDMCMPVIVGAGDGSASHAGALCFSPGDAYISLGSSSWYMNVIESPIMDNEHHLQCEPHVVPGLFMQGGTMQTGGLAYEWLKDSLYFKQFSYRKLENILVNSTPGSKGLMFFPFLLGERSPWSNPNVRGAYINISFNSDQADFVRSTLEGIAFNLYAIRSLCSQINISESLNIIGGGAASDCFVRIISNVFDKKVFVPVSFRDCCSIGAAIIGFLALNDNLDVKNECRLTKGYTIMPDKLEHDTYEAIFPIWRLSAESLMKNDSFLSRIRDLFQQ